MAKTISASIVLVLLALRALVHVARERRRAAEQIELASPRLRQMAAQVAVARVGRKRVPRLADGVIDDLEVALDDGDRRGVELSASLFQCLFEIRHRGVV